MTQATELERSTPVAPTAKVAELSAPDLLVRWGAATLATSVATFLTMIAVRRLAATDPTMAALGPLLWLGGISAPVIVAVKGIAIAVVLWSLLQLFDAPIGFKRCLATAWIAETVIAAASLLPALFALWRGPVTKADLLFRSGLDLFWTPATPALAQLSRSVNVFVVAWACWVVMMLAKEKPDAPVPALAAAALGAALLHVLVPLLTLPL